MKFSRDTKTVGQLRKLLADPSLLGPREAREATDDEICRAAEAIAETFSGLAAEVGRAFEPMADAIHRVRLGEQR